MGKINKKGNKQQTNQEKVETEPKVSEQTAVQEKKQEISDGQDTEVTSISSQQSFESQKKQDLNQKVEPQENTIQNQQAPMNFEKKQNVEVIEENQIEQPVQEKQPEIIKQEEKQVESNNKTNKEEQIQKEEQSKEEIKNEEQKIQENNNQKQKQTEEVKQKQEEEIVQKEEEAEPQQTKAETIDKEEDKKELKQEVEEKKEQQQNEDSQFTKVQSFSEPIQNTTEQIHLENLNTSQYTVPAMSQQIYLNKPMESPADFEHQKPKDERFFTMAQSQQIAAEKSSEVINITASIDVSKSCEQPSDKSERIDMGQSQSFSDLNASIPNNNQKHEETEQIVQINESQQSSEIASQNQSKTILLDESKGTEQLPQQSSVEPQLIQQLSPTMKGFIGGEASSLPIYSKKSLQLSDQITQINTQGQKKPKPWERLGKKNSEPKSVIIEQPVQESVIHEPEANKQEKQNEKIGDHENTSKTQNMPQGPIEPENKAEQKLYEQESQQKQPKQLQQIEQQKVQIPKITEEAILEARERSRRQYQQRQFEQKKMKEQKIKGLKEELGKQQEIKKVIEKQTPFVKKMVISTAITAVAAGASFLASKNKPIAATVCFGAFLTSFLVQ